MKTKKLKITCPNCRGSGYDSFREDGVSFKSGCTKCGGAGDEIYNKKKFVSGSGYIQVKFEVLNNDCEYCAGKGKVQCESVEYGKGFFGEYRKTRNYKAKCDNCLGLGKQLIAYYKTTCSNCSGSGKTSYWKKGLFGTDYKKTKACHICSGEGKLEEKSSSVFNGSLSSILY